ncbi:pilus assembly protein [Desulfosediminicola flagellatus]|uniref:pilus assembly protein n=1 Tax=Desulfosediminicola flagellatus TaxID=2569541 RepID=UPI0010ACD0BA|nr:hypothetical protein [Desulfosediminicola flagellatus]
MKWKHKSIAIFLVGLGMLALTGLRVEKAYAADVCSSGVAEPPFLSYGVKSNLLLVIDNSGSMLDMAYTDPDESQCFDDSYDTADVYIGIYEVEDSSGQDVWYQWQDGPYQQWESGEEYDEGDRVYVNGIIYQAYEDCTATGSYLYDDTACTWDKVFDYEGWKKSFDRWADDTAYAAGDTVTDGDRVYIAQKACVSNDPDNTDGETLASDIGCEWNNQNSSWLSDTTYAVGDIVSYEGKIFEATGGGPAMGDSPDDDIIGWTHIDEGKYVVVAGGAVNANLGCIAASGTASYNSDVCVSVKDTVTPVEVTAFYARGNFLNWVSASKFDIQKNILTGGKYDDIRDLLISENRGCGDRGFVKQVVLSNGLATTADDEYLTLRVRGPQASGQEILWDQIDSVDDVTRIEILNVSENGFDYGKCAPVIEASLDGSIQGDQNKVDNCLEPAPGVDASAYDQRAALNHGLQYCWQSNYNLSKIYATTGGGAGSCPTVYGAIGPGEISSFVSTYHCSGIFDADKPHDERSGYVGRCWDTGGGGAVTCIAKPALALADGGCDGNPCTYSQEMFKNEDGYNYECDDYNAGKNECKKDVYSLIYVQSDDLITTCVPVVATEFSGEIDGDTATVAPDLTYANTNYAGLIDNNGNVLNNAQWVCVYQAMEDYCADLRIPEVIDPSDQITQTSSSGNLPAILIDSGVLSQLGVIHPLKVFKGYIASSDTPEGILQEVKEDLRIGVMAFNDNGAKTECDAADTTDIIEQYCPGNTQDGAEVRSNIILGSADVGGGRQHIEDVVVAVNDTRATSWTPLAEAVYNAIGYYTQRTDLRLNDDDFQVSAGGWANATAYTIGDVVTSTDAGGDTIYFQATTTGTSSGTEPTDDAGVTWAQIENPDPVVNWCQENHILIITEGASTADINQDVIDFVGNAAINDGDQASDATCPNDLNASTYLDDLTYFAKNSDAVSLYGANSTLSTGEDSDGDGNIDEKEKQNITTHIVVAGTLRDTGNDECSPDELIRSAAENGGTGLVLGENPEDLENNLLEKFNELRQRSSAGSAASVISSSRGGEGAIYQAIFWPELNRNHQDGSEYKVEWVGDVHALFINDAGYMFEDTDQNRTLEPSEDIDGDGVLDVDEDANNDGLLSAGEDIDGDGKLDYSEDANNNGILDGTDLRVIIYFDETAGKSKACFNSLVFDTGTCTNSKDLEDVKFLWEAAGWLNDPALLTSSNRTYLSDDKERYIFTWIDLNNNGIVDDDYDGVVDDDDEVRPFVEGLALDASSNDLPVSGTRSPVYADFGVATSEEVDAIVSWSRGADSLINEDTNNDGILDAGEDLNGNGRLDKIMRSRQLPDQEGGTTLLTYRHPDTIHSTPMTVSEPAEGFQFLYRDRSYARFVAAHKDRRHMIYYGKNNGMLSAVNGGFYKEDEKKFCLTSTEDASGNCDESAGNFPALGAEMWSYIPYNILPHLSCLTDEAYAHKYFIDLRPRIFDVKIFQEESSCTDAGGNSTPTAAGCYHPDGWGTILVGGMRLGGAPANAYEVSVDPTDGLAEDNRRFISSYFILDITNPEAPPIVLGELTQTLDNSGNPNYVDLGYSAAIPTMVIMKNPATHADGFGVDGPEANEWYLILGSGPHGPDAVEGVSDQNAKVSVIPLSWLNGTDVADSSGKTALRIPATAPTSGASGGTFDLAGSPNGFTSDLITVDFDISPSTFDYMADTVYFGTTEGNFITNADETTEWDGGGKMYRLVTRPISGGSSTYGNGVEQVPTTPNEWQILPLIDLSGDNRPISSAPSVGYDGRNFWVYFGTGRFWDPRDKTDTNQQTFFGIKEPMIFDGTTGDPQSFLWGEVEFTDNINPTTGADTGMGNNGAGDRGLLRVDNILVAQSSEARYSKLSCLDTTDTTNGSPLGGGSTLTCVPAVIRQGTTPDTAYFAALEKYVAGIPVGDCTNDNADCTDGWYKDFWPYTNRERNLGQGTLLGGLLTFTTYQPFSDVCQAEGEAYLYAVYYKTGTSWYENVFGDEGLDAYGNVENKLDLGRGLATTPNLHTGSGGSEGPRAFVQTSTGEIKEIQQENLPIKAYKSGRSKWKEYIP